MNLEEIVSDLNFRSDHRVSFNKEKQSITVKKTSVDVNDPSKYAVLTRRIAPHRCCTELEVVGMIREAMHQLDCHEIDEWFTYKGERIYDPHR